MPATLELSRADYFSACALIGALAAQKTEPDIEWTMDWAVKVGAAMAKKSR